MRTEALQGALEHLRLVDHGGLTDAQLLARFLDGAEEAAFAALVRRHGAMVLGVCRRLLRHEQDAEDAFQAAFLVLAKKAASVAKREAVASFLYGVAYRTALRTRARAARRRGRETQVDVMPHPEVAPPEPEDWRPLLDRELHQLPQKYRAAVVLCDLECKSRREAARLLGIKEGTLASRLATARRMLARRLARSGLALSGGALAAILSEGAASAAVPAGLMVATVKAATQVAAGHAAVLATPAAALMNEVIRSMLMTKLKTGVVVVLAAALLGLGGLAYRAAGQQPTATPPAAPVTKPLGERPLSELELLRREVEILKLQMELVQSELRALKGHGKKTMGGNIQEAVPVPRQPHGKKPPEGNIAPPTAPEGETRTAPPASTSLPPAGPVSPLPAVELAPVPPPAIEVGGGDVPTPVAVPPRTEDEVERAIRAYREARDHEPRVRAAEALEKALKKVRKRLQPDGNTTPPAS